jgi:exopolyphosphatase / guanosine-5'-triphosphate,3'-diphosphate pyrophosphatase
VKSPIVPRWEWRAFGQAFPEVEARLGPEERVQESDELYLLSSESDASVKVRDGLLDVKRLERVDEAGLEQWRPVLKVEFVLSADDVRTLLDALGIVGLRAVAVQKRRRHFTFGACMAELSEFRTDRGSTLTVAVESEDPARVLAAVRSLGLDARPNVSVPRALKTLAGIGAHRYAVVDVGTNSVKFHVGERSADGSWATVADRAQVTRLGEGLDATGRLGEEPMRRTVDAIAAMVDEAKRDGVEEIAAVGTAGLRIADNSADFLEAVRGRTGVDIEVISGEEEGRLAYLAATAQLGQPGGSLVVFDTGGGSSQFTFGRGREVDERFSVNVGAARFTERFGLGGVVDEETVAGARDAIATELGRLDGRAAPEALIGMGGANTNLAAVKLALASYDANAVQGTVLEAAEIDRQIELYRTRDADDRRSIVGLQPDRAEVILAGACIVRTVLAKLGRDSLVVSDRGLRHGLLRERFGGESSG